VTESYRKTEGQAVVLPRARALAHVLDQWRSSSGTGS
jgi:hypothetical protein